MSRRSENAHNVLNKDTRDHTQRFVSILEANKRHKKLSGQVKRSSLFQFMNEEKIVYLDDYTNIMIYGLWNFSNTNTLGTIPLEGERRTKTPYNDDAP